MSKYKILSHKKMYNGRIIDVYNDEVVLQDDKIAVREIVVHHGASAIIPIDSDGKIIFVRQYRHPAREEVLEIPAGTLEKNEDPKVCAYRELEEEIGFKSENISFLTKMYSAIGFSTEILYIYLAENLIPGKQQLDSDEFITTEKYSLDEAVEMVFNGEIKDSKTIVAIFLYKELLTK